MRNPKSRTSIPSVDVTRDAFYFMHSPRFLLALAVFIVPMGARAADDEPPPRAAAAAAEALFQSGREAMDAKDYEAAREAFSESQRLEPAAGTLMNLATAEEKLNMPASAWGHFQHALQMLSSDDRRRPFVNERIAELETSLPRLAISPAAGAPQDLQIERSGLVLGKASWGVALPVDPGSLTIVVRAPHHEPRTYSIDVIKGQTETLTVRPGKEIRESTERRNPTLRTLGYVAGGVGIAGVGLGVVTSALLPKTREVAVENCPNDSCNEEGWRAVRRGKRLLALNTVGFAVGGVGLVSGALLFIASGKTSEERDDADLRKGGDQRADIWLGPGAIGLEYGGTF